jgi:hypothetical protein
VYWDLTEWREEVMIEVDALNTLGIRGAGYATRCQRVLLYFAPATKA